ncbi:MAG: MmcQ/YjbR family DNA-binding protein [Phycisphaerales bacterium]|nr:MmcQ/YjbR family DNA-binding protein [Phycisphaerales bacterium]
MAKRARSDKSTNRAAKHTSISLAEFIRHVTREPLTRRDQSRLGRVFALAETLPSVTTTPFGERHISFGVGKKTFAYYLNNHHGDGVIALCCKASPARQQELVTREPQRYRVPAYLGRAGWVSIRLDMPDADWAVLLEQFIAAYRAQAPKRLLALID